MAEYVVSQVINWERRIKDIHKWQDQKFWPPQMYMGRSLNDLQVGILGYGNMGKAVAKALQVFECSGSVRGLFTICKSCVNYNHVHKEYHIIKYFFKKSFCNKKHQKNVMYN